MAHTLTTKKNIRITARRTAINKSRKSRIRTFLRKVEDAVLAKNKELAKTALVEFESEIMKGVSKGVYKKNTAARKIRRMAKQVNSI
mgnify:CR=1 FL=1